MIDDGNNVHNENTVSEMMCVFLLVMRFRAEAELDCVDPDMFVELYLAGRAKSTFMGSW